MGWQNKEFTSARLLAYQFRKRMAQVILKVIKDSYGPVEFCHRLSVMEVMMEVKEKEDV